MKIHLSINDSNEKHTRFTMFVNGVSAGELCVLTAEFPSFHQIVAHGCSASIDTFLSSGNLFLGRPDEEVNVTLARVAFGNAEFAAAPALSVGDLVRCPRCNGEHVVFGSTDAQGRPTGDMLAYHCGARTYLAGVNGRNVMRLLRTT